MELPLRSHALVLRLKIYATLSCYAGGLFPGTAFKVELPKGASLKNLVVYLKIPAEETGIAFVKGVIQRKEMGQVRPYQPVCFLRVKRPDDRQENH